MTRLTLFTLALVLVADGAARACPSCRESIATPVQVNAVNEVPQGFNRSIYLILGGLFIVAGSGSFLVAREVRRCGVSISDANAP